MGRREDLRRQIERAERELAKLDALPDFEELPEGSVVALVVTLGRSRPYTFVGLKTAGKWYLTGHRSPNGATTAELEDWLTTQGRRLVGAKHLATVEVQTVGFVDLGAALLASIQEVSPAEEAALYAFAPDEVVSDYEARRGRRDGEW